MELTRANLLAVINRASEYADLASTADHSSILRAGLMPKEFLRTQFDNVYPERLIKLLIDDGFISESPSFLIPNPRKRHRPIATRYDRQKPRPNSRRSPTTYNVFGKDRLLLWYAAANESRSGSRGEGYGLWMILEFFREPRVQKLWRKYIKKANWRIPEDAQ